MPTLQHNTKAPLFHVLDLVGGVQVAATENSSRTQGSESGTGQVFRSRRFIADYYENCDKVTDL